MFKQNHAVNRHSFDAISYEKLTDVFKPYGFYNLYSVCRRLKVHLIEYPWKCK